MRYFYIMLSILVTFGSYYHVRAASVSVPKTIALPKKVVTSDELYNRLVLIFDLDNQELESTSSAFTYDFGSLLFDKKTPVLISVSIVKNFLKEAKAIEQQKIIDHYKNRVQDNDGWECYREKIGWQDSIALFQFIIDDWLIYKHKTQAFLLFIPRVYAQAQATKFEKVRAQKKQQLTELELLIKHRYAHQDFKSEERDINAQAKTNYEQERAYMLNQQQELLLLISTIEARLKKATRGDDRLLISCGFNPDHLVQQEIRALDDLDGLVAPVLKKTDFKSRLDYEKEEEKSLIAIKEILLGRGSLLAEWLLYIGGHGGSAATPIYKSPAEFNILKIESKRLLDLILSLEGDLKIALGEQSGKSTEILQQIEELRTKVQKYRQDIRKSTFDAATAYIAGLPYNLFEKLLIYFNDNNVRFLFYVTCFSGGINQRLIDESLRRMPVNFYLAARGFADLSVASDHHYFITYAEDDAKKPFQITSNIDWYRFFNVLENLMSGKNVGVMRAKTVAGINNPWAYVFSNIQVNKWVIRYPGIRSIFMSDQFMNGTILNITTAFQKAHELDNRPIHAENRRLLLVYPQRVAVPLYVGDLTEIACLSTPKIARQFEADSEDFKKYSAGKRHYFMRIHTSADLNMFITNILKQFGPHPSTIYIKTLECRFRDSNELDELFSTGRSGRSFQDPEAITFRNVIISGALPGAISIQCVLDQQTYELQAEYKEPFSSFTMFDSPDGSNLFSLEQQKNYRPLNAKLRKSSEPLTLQKFVEMTSDIPLNIEIKESELELDRELREKQVGLTPEVYKIFTEKIEKALAVKTISWQSYDHSMYIAEQLRERNSERYQQLKKEYEKRVYTSDDDEIFKIAAQRMLKSGEIDQAQYEALDNMVRGTLYNFDEYSREYKQADKFFDDVQKAFDTKKISKEMLAKYRRQGFDTLVGRIKGLSSDTSFLNTHKTEAFDYLKSMIQLATSKAKKFRFPMPHKKQLEEARLSLKERLYLSIQDDIKALTPETKAKVLSINYVLDLLADQEKLGPRLVTRLKNLEPYRTYIREMTAGDRKEDAEKMLAEAGAVGG